MDTFTENWEEVKFDDPCICVHCRNETATIMIQPYVWPDGKAMSDEQSFEESLPVCSNCVNIRFRNYSEAGFSGIKKFVLKGHCVCYCSKID